MKKAKVENVILAALAGVASGTLIGLLFAPDKGEATRKKISQKGDDYLKKVRHDIKELRVYLEKRADQTQKEINELGQKARKKAKDVFEKAEKSNSFEEWTKDELYQYARELKIEGYSKMNKQELVDALKANYN